MHSPKIVCLIPTRGDRQVLLANCLRMIAGQTLVPIGVEIMDDPPLNPMEKDITYRYRVGTQRIVGKYPDVDLIALIEDDDWYSSIYLERMWGAWTASGKPQIFGISDTCYYHLGQRAHNYQVHHGRASAFSTVLTPAITQIKWPADSYPFTDIEMWKQLRGKTHMFDVRISLGIKGHSVGKFFGGIGHNAQWGGYNKSRDPDLSWLRSIVDPESFDFYQNFTCKD